MVSGLAGRHRGLEAEAAGVDADISGLQHEEEALRVAAAGAVTEKHRVGLSNATPQVRGEVLTRFYWPPTSRTADPEAQPLRTCSSSGP